MSFAFAGIALTELGDAEAAVRSAGARGNGRARCFSVAEVRAASEADFSF